MVDQFGFNPTCEMGRIKFQDKTNHQIDTQLPCVCVCVVKMRKRNLQRDDEEKRRQQQQQQAQNKRMESMNG